MKYSEYEIEIKRKLLSKDREEEFSGIYADKILDRYKKEIEECDLDDNIKAFILEELINTAWDQFKKITNIYCEFIILLKNFVNDPENFQNLDTFTKLTFNHINLCIFITEEDIFTDKDFDQYCKKFNSSLQKVCKKCGYIYPIEKIIEEDFLNNFFYKYETIKNWRNRE